MRIKRKKKRNMGKRGEAITILWEKAFPVPKGSRNKEKKGKLRVKGTKLGPLREVRRTSKREKKLTEK